MAIHSYSQPSSGSGSDSTVGMRVAANVKAIKEYGLLKECYCGARAVLDTCHSTMDPGRRFYSCPNFEDGDCHVWKWWDETVMEELTLMYSDYGDLVEKMEAFTYPDEFYMAKAEIDELKQKHLQTEEKIANMEILVAEMKKKESGITISLKVQIVVYAVVILLGIGIMMWFK